MARRSSPEELRFFDLGEVAGDGEAAAPPPARERAARAAASALQRRVERVSARARPVDLSGHPDAAEETGLVPEVPRARPVEEGEETLTIAGFYALVRDALAGAFPGEVWVSGEIRGLKEARGHRYLELADAGADPAARGGQQLEVVCWASEWPRVASQLMTAGVSLEVGRVVRVRGRVSVWEGGSRLRFVLKAIDVEALLGGIAAARHRLLQALMGEGLLQANAARPLPLVPLRIGLVTSAGSEAHRDFIGQLERSGFAFTVRLEQSLVQGPEAPRQIASALARLERFAPDLAVVVRGGGARGDLAAFDSEEVARAIATAPFPVWTGIGHTGDRSVADEVAQRACITPTACGEAVVAVVCAYRDHIDEQMAELSRLARARLDSAGHLLDGRRQAVGRGVRHQLARRADGLRGAHETLARAAQSGLTREGARLVALASVAASATRRVLEREEQDHRRCAQVLRAYDPRRQLERGWSLTRDPQGRLVRSVAGLHEGIRLVTRFADGEAGVVVAEVRDAAPERRKEPS